MGELLLMSALSNSLAASRKIASMAVVVDAKDENAKIFYRRYGFMEFPDYANRLFLPMETIERMFDQT